jgi:4'-phosphopantetheinyl transferase EntD
VLPPDVVVVERRPTDLTKHLYAIEEALVANAVPKRRNEFSTGRAAARTALDRLGARPVPIPADADGAPMWPSGFVGSLSHTRQHCVAAVAPRTRYASIGIDVEGNGSLEDDVIRLICTEAEIEALGRGPLSRARAAVVVFSAKECFYKFQYPLTGRRLGFLDVAVRLDWTASVFEVIPTTGPRALSVVEPLTGRFFECCGLVATGMALASTDGQETRHALRRRDRL